MRKKIRKSKVLDTSPLPPPPLPHNDLKFLVQQHSQFLDKLVEFNHLLVQQHSQFLGKLVELIPTNFCPPVEVQEEGWVQDLNRDGKAYAKKGSRKIIKKNGRSRLDPEDSPGTLDLLKTNFAEENEKAEEENDVKNKVTIPEELLTPEELRERFERYLRGEVLDPPPLPAENNQRCTVRLSKPLQKRPGLTYAELRERFHRRMEELRSTRPLPPPLAAEDQVQPRTPDLSMLFPKPRYPYAELRESNRMKKRLAKREREMGAAELRESNRMKKRLAKRKREMGAASVKKQEVVDAVVAETQKDVSEAVKIGEEEVIKVARRNQVKNRKIGKKEKSSCA